MHELQALHVDQVLVRDASSSAGLVGSPNNGDVRVSNHFQPEPARALDSQASAWHPRGRQLPATWGSINSVVGRADLLDVAG